MFWVQFTHFYASSWSWKPSDEYNPIQKLEARCDIQTEERPWRPRADCARNRTARPGSQRSLWSRAPPLTRRTKDNRLVRLPPKAFTISHVELKPQVTMGPEREKRVSWLWKYQIFSRHIPLSVLTTQRQKISPKQIQTGYTQTSLF